jgi:hypothetical protein
MAHLSGNDIMTATVYTRFVDPQPFRETKNRWEGPAKAAKPAKAIEPAAEQTATFATFAAFAGAPAENRIAASQAEPWTDAHEERAAIIEHDGGVPQAWAEALARLDSAKPPADVPSRRWLAFVDDCGRFLDAGWAERAAALGWGPLDLFGCDRERPFARIDRMGLLWLLDGGKLIELHRDRALIETTAGARQCFRRKPVDIGCVVLAWELLQQ